jgi:hypothetical protein
MDSAAKLLLPGIDYFQVVFTMPAELSSLALGNRREMFDLLFRSAWRALKRVIEDEQQFEAAASMMLHTWNQKLESHVHVHAFVPGGGPSLADPEKWISSHPPAHETQKRFWLVDADELRIAFRTEFLKGLRSLHRRNKLKLTCEWKFLQDVAAFNAWLKPLETISWVTFIQPPPKLSSPENVLKYLARYMTGGPISDRRLVRHENGIVTFTARSGTTKGGSDEIEDVEMSGEQFVRRWAMHILPKGYTKTRRFGGFSNHHRKRYMAECRELLSISEASGDDPSAAATDDVPAEHRCPHCESLMVCISRNDRPGWAVVMNGSARPIWYDDG